MLAATNPFVFGSFSLYEGRSSYNLSQISVKNHFTELANLQPGVYYGFYFLEISDYFGREYTDEIQMINLLYVTMKVLLNSKIEDALIRRIFELKTMVIQGEYPQMFSCCHCETTENLVEFSEEANGILCKNCGKNVLDAHKMDTSTLYTMQYIIGSPVEKLYTFTVTEEVQSNLDRILARWMDHHLDKTLKSQAILEMML